MTITADNPHGYIFAERGSFEWNAAWQELIAVGHQPENFMLMHGEPKNGAVTWGFKHIDNREYVYITVTE